MAANQLRAPSVVMGWPIFMVANSPSLGLNATTTWLAFSFVLDQTKTLNKVKLYMVTKTGTPATTELTCELYSDTAGVPNASIESSNADAVGASGTWIQWSAFTSSCTAGVMYWLVFKNSNGTAASNFPTYQWVGAAGTAGGAMILQGNFGTANAPFGWNKVHTTNSGTAWATAFQPAVGGPRLEFSDATFDGFPSFAVARPSSATNTDRAFGTQEVGVRFNVPAGVTYNIRGVWFLLNKTSTPGNLRFRLYQGVTLVGTTTEILAANVNSTSQGDGYVAFFSSTISIISTNQPFRVVIGDATAGDGNTVGYNAAIFSFENDADSLALKPMNGTLQKTVTTDNTANPVVFSDTATTIYPFALLLDTAGEFTAAGAGGGGTFMPPQNSFV